MPLRSAAKSADFKLIECVSCPENAAGSQDLRRARDAHVTFHGEVAAQRKAIEEIFFVVARDVMDRIVGGVFPARVSGACATGFRPSPHDRNELIE